MPNAGVCALCQRGADLRLSHIVPSFFGTYLKETSATGYLRGAIAPNLRRQDLLKRRLLCDCCEGRFGAWEKEYKEQAFDAVQDDNFNGLTYGSWLLPFLVSISWRVLVTEQKELLEAHPQFSRHIGVTLENWRRFLLEERKKPQSEHHLFIFAGMPSAVPSGSHAGSLDYIYRAIDATTAVGKRSFFVYTKALRSLIISPVLPSFPSGLTNTRVHAGHGRLVSPQKIAMPGFGGFLNSRIEQIVDRQLSEKQKAKIEKTLLLNPDKALASESFKVHLARERLIPRSRQ